MIINNQLVLPTSYNRDANPGSFSMYLDENCTNTRTREWTYGKERATNRSNSNPTHGPLEWDYFMDEVTRIDLPQIRKQIKGKSQNSSFLCISPPNSSPIFTDAEMSLSRSSSSTSFVPLWDSADPGNSPPLLAYCTL